jgi:two-component system sensor kinase FixL
LLVLCLAAWIAATRAMFGCRRALLEYAETAEIKERVVQERDLLRTIIDDLPDRIYAKDKDGRFVLNNQAHAKAVGAESPQAMLGKSDFDYYPQEMAVQYRADEEKILQTRLPVLDQEQLKSVPGDRTGEKRWCIASKVLWRNSAGEILGTAGITHDIHESKMAQDALHKSEKLYRTLIDSLPQHVFFKDRQSAFVSVNAAFARLLGKSADELIGNTDSDFFPKKLAEKYRADDQRIMNSRRVETIEETNIVEGQRRTVEVVKAPVIGDDGQIIGLLGIFTDITERKVAEEKVRQFTVQLERSNRELQDFAYVASHDLQEPLRKIVVFGERLKEKTGDALAPEPRDYLERMQKAAARMQSLINDLLTFSRVTTKAHPFAPVNLADVAGDVVADLEGRLEQVNGRVELGTLPVIEAEELQVRQLLQNLIGNALKFHRPEEPPVVKVEAQIISVPQAQADRRAPAPQLCQLTVTDNGIGFDEKYLDRIFNVFQRLHSRGEYEGTGMGLAIARKIVLYHGGEITAKSKPGCGATFIVTLPVVHPKES